MVGCEAHLESELPLFSLRILSLWGTVEVLWSLMNRLERCLECRLKPPDPEVPE